MTKWEENGERPTSPLRGKQYEPEQYIASFLSHINEVNAIVDEVIGRSAHPAETLSLLPMDQKTEYTITIASLIYENPSVNSPEDPNFSEELKLHGVQTALIYVLLLEFLLSDFYHLVELSPHGAKFTDAMYLQYLVALAYAHDGGKTPEYICKIARSKVRFEEMTPEEAESSIFIIRQHTLAIAHIFNRLGYEQFAQEMLMYHHEREDGKGYPIGLISLPAPIALLAAADSLASILEPSKEREKSWSIVDLFLEIDNVFASEKMSHAADIIKTMLYSVLKPEIINNLMVLPSKEVILQRIMTRGKRSFIVQESRPLRVLFGLE